MPSREELRERYRRVRGFTEELCAPLSPEDMVAQSMSDASPAKWHLAHTTWFFETFLLSKRPAYRLFDTDFCYLFNSYYNAIGDRHARPHRGLLTRPTIERVREYREYVDAAMDELLAGPDGDASLVELGLNHEQQHQELLLTDLKHLLSCNALLPAYRDDLQTANSNTTSLEWTEFDGGIFEIGHSGSSFCFDNELPRHKALVHPFALANRLVTNGEFAEFIDAGGYEKPEYWLSAGWEAVQERNWDKPVYWHREGASWSEFTLAGLRKIEESAPVCHLSFFEADAYARWAGYRLPTEFEWEVAASTAELVGNFVEDGRMHPVAAGNETGVRQLFGDVWEWTGSAYLGYPGYKPAAGAVGEYNGKFMCNQFVLRGGSCATSPTHIRASYRNFFPPDARWQFSGLRLAR